MLEDEIRKKTIKYLITRHKCKVVRIETSNTLTRVGVPDLLIFTKGKHPKVLELKTTKGRLSPAQKRIQEDVPNHDNCDVMYGFDKDFLDAFIKRG